MMTSDVTENQNSSMLPMTSACHLSGIRKWSRKVHLTGISVSGDLWALDQKFFSCCGGTGIEIQSLSTRSARLCGLVGRWSLLKSHLMQINEFFPTQKLDEVVGASGVTRSSASHQRTIDALEHWRNLHAPSFVMGAKGRLIADATQLAPGLSITWAGVASCIWHDGIRVFVHVHGSGSAAVAKWQRDLQSAKNLRTVLVIERVHNLFDAAKLLEFDDVVSFASKNRIPLWVVLNPSRANSSETESAASQRFAKSLNKKMTNYRNASIEQSISPQTLGRLLEVCDLPLRKNVTGGFVMPPVV